MRIAVLSDSMLPTPTAGGHGLGRVVHIVATELLNRGHDVMLIARPGSSFAGNLVMPPDSADHANYSGEIPLAREAMRLHRDWPFDAFLDNGHLHVLAAMFPDLPVVNVFHDIYENPARCPVVLSEGQRAIMPPPFEHARIIHNALYPDQFAVNLEPSDPPYALWMGVLADFKQPLLAIEACARYGVKLVMAGGEMLGRMPWNDNGSVSYRGVVHGRERDDLLRNARVFLQLGIGESYGLTTMEAGLSGTPVVAWPGGGSLDLVRYGVNGAFVATTGRDPVQNVCDALDVAWWLDRQTCREWAEGLSNVEAQIDAYEQALEDVATGAWW